LKIDIHLRLLYFAQVPAFEPTLHKGIPKPSHQSIAERKREAAKRNRGDQWLSITVKGIDQDAKARQSEREKGINLRVAQRSRHDKEERKRKITAVKRECLRVVVVRHDD